MTDADETALKALSISVLTVSDTRNIETDTSGDALIVALTEAGHGLAHRQIVGDDVYRIREVVSRWIADPDIDAIITTGGTGVTGRDSTPEAVAVLLDKHIDGFGELFRMISFEEIGASSLQSRCIAGVANATFVFVLPGSTNACRTGWRRLIGPQLDSRTRPCNLADLMPRLQE